MRRWGKLGLGVAVILGLIACVLVAWVGIGHGLGEASLLAGVIAAVAGVVAAVAAVWPLVASASRVPVLAGLEMPEWVVDRPAEVGQIVSALIGSDRTVGITTGLHGAGGFGKTTLARMVCADRRVRHRYRGGIFLVTVGRDIRGPAMVAEKVNEVIKAVAGEDVTFTDSELAGGRLGALLDSGPRRLLVVDDVWEPGQLAPFTVGGRRCARLVTTRMPALLGSEDAAVQVDQMSVAQARRLLTDGLPPLDPAAAHGLLAVTGRWPLLLRLVNKILANAAVTGADVAVMSAQLVKRLRAGGPAVVDDLLGDDPRALNVGQSADRARAIRATIGASTSLLDHEDAQRFAELAVFAEDEIIPFSLAACLWRATAGLDELQATRVFGLLAGLGLVILRPGDAGRGGAQVHDVIRDFLRGELGAQSLADLHGALLDAVAVGLPSADSLTQPGRPVRTAWWELVSNSQYMMDHLVEHLMGAGRNAEAEEIAADLRWVAARLRESGPAAPATDLSLTGSTRETRLTAALARAAHLLAPTDPPEAVMDVLSSRLAQDPDWGPQVSALQKLRPEPRLVNRWPLPDLPNPALRRVLAGSGRRVGTAAVAPDGSWLAAGSSDGAIRIWDVSTGQLKAAFTGHRMSVIAMAAAPDGSWLATGGGDKRVRIWDAETWKERAVLPRHHVTAIAVAPDGSWLATGSIEARRIRIWDTTTGKERASIFTGLAGSVTAVAVAPDGSWLVTGTHSQGVRIWDIASGKERRTLSRQDITAEAARPADSQNATGRFARMIRTRDTAATRLMARFGLRNDWVTSVAVAPDGTWLAGGGVDGMIRVWNPATGKLQATLAGHSGPVVAVAVAPDASWIAAAASSGTIRIWDTATSRQQSSFPTHGTWTTAIAVPADGTWLGAAAADGTVSVWDVNAGRSQTAHSPHAIPVNAAAAAPGHRWLVTGGPDETMRVWDATSGNQRETLAERTGVVSAIAVAQDGSWVATCGGTEETRIWHLAASNEQAVLPGNGAWTSGIAAGPDGSWLATSGLDRTVRIWDVATGQQQAVLSGHRRGVYTVAVAPDGRWLASGGLDGTIRIWDVATGQQQALLAGHRDAVFAVAVAPDGRWLASASPDRTLRIWETLRWQPQTMMRVDGEIFTVLWLGNDGVASGGPAGVYVFNFHLDTKDTNIQKST